MSRIGVGLNELLGGSGPDAGRGTAWSMRRAKDASAGAPGEKPLTGHRKPRLVARRLRRFSSSWTQSGTVGKRRARLSDLAVHTRRLIPLPPNAY